MALRLMAALLLCGALGYVPPEQHVHEQLVAMQSGFSRFGEQGLQGAISREELPRLLRFVFESTRSDASLPPAAHAERMAELLTAQLAPEREQFTLDDLLVAMERTLLYPQSLQEEHYDEPNTRLGSKQLRKLRSRLEHNRLTMPLFDTKGWVRDFEKALKMQWEIYANGLSPMHIVVARSDRLYGTEVIV
mmetsp:Transcript_27747/g.67285  ORF Transcript_27747/g.67285 Transcript_27747/m.67285 type:complete len:191 (+) Transcript_27747:2-574(+)